MKTTQQMQEELTQVWPNVILAEDYKGANEKHLLKCNKCNHEWKTTPRSVVVSAKGCPSCGVSKKVQAIKENTKQDFLNRLSDDFELIEYIDESKITVKCKICNNLRTTSKSNILRYDCKSCASSKANEPRKLTNEIFKDKANEIHYNIYNYSKVNYVDYNTKVTIICKEHGDFEQAPSKHLAGQGCPKCNIYSKGELIVDKELKRAKIQFEAQKQFKLYKTIYVDFYLTFENKKYIIEVNGEQHYKPIK